MIFPGCNEQNPVKIDTFLNFELENWIKIHINTKFSIKLLILSRTFIYKIFTIKLSFILVKKFTLVEQIGLLGYNKQNGPVSSC